MKKFTPISLLCSGLWVSCNLPNQKPAKDALPNIVLLIGDDHGYPYFGFMGANYVQTPHMDKIVA